MWQMFNCVEIYLFLFYKSLKFKKYSVQDLFAMDFTCGKK